MTEIAQRVERLGDRIKRKREEVCHYLDVEFYHNCRSILDAVMKIDEDGVFAKNPSRLPAYTSTVQRPMWWGCILSRLKHYDYSNSMEFVQDMRLVVNNCYTYNEDTSSPSKLCRRIEISMEDLFVTELFIDPPDTRKITELGRHADTALSKRMWKIICFYEDIREEWVSKRHIFPARLKCVTQRRVIALLRANAKNREERDKVERAPAAQHRAKTVPKPAQPPLQHQQTARAMLETDADVEFAADIKGSEVQRETQQQQQHVQQQQQQQQQLEHVPQNQRTGLSTFDLVSPVCLDDSGSDENSEVSGLDHRVMSSTLTKDHYAGVRKIQRVLLGPRAGVPRPDLVDFAAVGLIHFLGEKEAKLRALVRQMDLRGHEALRPIQQLAEFISFVVGGLSVEADKMEEAIGESREAVAAMKREIQRGELELQYRQQHTGTNVTRALARFYCTNPVIPSSTANSEGGEILHKFAQAIAEDRTRLREAKSELRVLLSAQRLLWGSAKAVEEDVLWVVQDSSVALAIRRFNHKVRDIMLSLRKEAETPLRCLESLAEFITHVDIGLSAATEDLDACLVSLKKHIMLHEEDSRVRSLSSMRERPASQASRGPSLKYSLSGLMPAAPSHASATETEELSRLYCY